MNKIITAFVILGGFMASATVQAVPYIDGSIRFNGYNSAVVDITGEAAGQNEFLYGTGFDFSDGPNIQVATGTGSYASSVGQIGTINDFVFEPLQLGGVDPVWILLNGFAFNLQTVEKISRSSFSLAIQGTGVAYDQAGNYAPTPGTFSFSTQGNAKNTTFTFSAGSTSAAPVPDGGLTLGFLGLSLLGLVAMHRQS
ncbi:MAG TPA: hypothetical protein VF773_08785 [Verrucomicrobiae bacterium]